MALAAVDVINENDEKECYNHALNLVAKVIDCKNAAKVYFGVRTVGSFSEDARRIVSPYSNIILLEGKSADDITKQMILYLYKT